jgi:hypothetical protein
MSAKKELDNKGSRKRNVTSENASTEVLSPECNRRTKRKIDEKEKLLQKIKQLEEKNKRIENENKQLDEENKKINGEIKQQIEIISKLEESINHSRSINHAFYECMHFILEFMATLRTIFKDDDIYNPSLYGSFPRQIFERLMNDAYQHYADCRGTRLSFVICNGYIGTFAKSKVKSDFNKFTNNLKTYISLSKYIPANEYKPATFGTYVLSAVSDTTDHSVPHVKLYFKGFNEDIEVNIFAWRITDNKVFFDDDFDVNAIYLNSKGFFVSDLTCCESHNFERNFFDILTKIRNKEATYDVNLESYELKWLKEHDSIRKEKYLVEMVLFILHGWYEITKSGYTMVSGYHGIPLIQREQEQICPITFVEPPYYVIGLKCNCGNNERSNQRLQSLKSYVNMIIHSQLKCPYCRNKDGMRLLFINRKATESTVWLPKIPDRLGEPYGKKYRHIDT